MDLYLQDLTPDMTGMTIELRSTFAQAAAVCFESQGHTPGVALIIRGSQAGAHHAFWEPVSQMMRDSWDDPNEATESGAVGVAVVLVNRLLDKKVMKRARIGTGFDYWLAECKEEESVDMFEKTTRLEVSGIRQAEDRTVDARVEQKLKQTRRSNNDFPVIVVVVEFGTPQAKIVSK
jgi:hypothetical protein